MEKLRQLMPALPQKPPQQQEQCSCNRHSRRTSKNQATWHL